MFTMLEGIHSLPCPKCNQKTKVHVERVGDRWEVRTGSESESGSQESSVSLEPSDRVELKDALTPKEMEEPMSKPKLTKEKRSALRGEIERSVKAGTPQARIFEVLAKKYGVVPETIRYHLNGLKKKSRPEPKKPTAGGSPKGTKAAGTPTKKKSLRKAKQAVHRSARKTSVKAITNGLGTLRIADAVKRLTEKDLERALEARKLLPKVEASRASALELRSKAREAEAQTARLERQFKKLVR